jgi:hypothetical protein
MVVRSFGYSIKQFFFGIGFWQYVTKTNYLQLEVPLYKLGLYTVVHTILYGELGKTDAQITKDCKLTYTNVIR